MVQFNELTISPDGKCLHIDVSIKEEEYFQDVYIKSIIIDSAKTFTTNGPSDDPLYIKDFRDVPKRAVLELSPSDLNVFTKIDFNKDILFVYVVTGGIPSADTPCGEDEPIQMQSVFNLYPLYQKAMNYISELSDTCNTPDGFIDYILRLKALELAVDNGNYNTAIKQLQSLHKGASNISRPKCGCHG